jgi:hypothetical protein
LGQGAAWQEDQLAQFQKIAAHFTPTS